MEPQAHAILRPPKEAVHARFYPDGVWEEDREYLRSIVEDSDIHAHGYRGYGVPADSAVYFGDRSAPMGTHGIAKRRAQVCVSFATALQQV